MAITAKTVLVFWTLLHHLCCSALPKLAYKDYSDKVAWVTRGDGYDYDYDYSDYNYHQQVNLNQYKKGIFFLRMRR